MADGEILYLIIIHRAVNIFLYHANVDFKTLCLMGIGIVQKGYDYQIGPALPVSSIFWPNPILYIKKDAIFILIVLLIMSQR